MLEFSEFSEFSEYSELSENSGISYAGLFLSKMARRSSSIG